MHDPTLFLNSPSDPQIPRQGKNKTGRARSIDLSLFAPLFTQPRIRWVSLQYGDHHALEDQAAAAKAPILVDPSVDQLLDIDSAFPFGSCCPSRPTGVGFKTAIQALGIPPCAFFDSPNSATGHPLFAKLTKPLG
jgi:hypothetical protein